MDMPSTLAMNDRDRQITAAVLRERSKLAAFIRRRVPNPQDAEDLLQDVFYEFVRAYRLPEPIERAGAWLYRVARNRIIDRFRMQKDRPLLDATDQPDATAGEYSLDVALPSPDDGPQALLARDLILDALQEALLELPLEQREVFVAHELDGESFKDMAGRCGLSINTLLARKRYAVLHLRARLRAVYDELDR
jgi:RNA polymerase sigma factor (sigma-70 family)